MCVDLRHVPQFKEHMSRKRANQQDHTRLREFAAAHRLRVRTFTLDGEDPDVVKGHVICFGVRAAVSELADIPRLLGVNDAWSAKPGWLKRYDVQKRLCFSIWPLHVDYLYQTIRFDSYLNSGRASEAESTTWGKILRSSGIRYLTESANGIAFMFPTEDEAAVRTILALAAAKVALKDFGQSSESMISARAASGGQGLLSDLLAQAAIQLRWSNRSKAGAQRLRV